jgi:hypothetical protein
MNRGALIDASTNGCDVKNIEGRASDTESGKRPAGAASLSHPGQRRSTSELISWVVAHSLYISRPAGPTKRMRWGKPAVQRYGQDGKEEASDGQSDGKRYEEMKQMYTEREDG